MTYLPWPWILLVWPRGSAFELRLVSTPHWVSLTRVVESDRRTLSVGQSALSRVFIGGLR